MVDEQGAVVLQYVATIDEHAEGATAWATQRLRGQRRGVVVIAAAVALLFAATGQWVYLAADLVAAGLVVTGWQHRSAYRRQFKANPWNQQPSTVRVGQEGVSCASTGFEVRFAWARLPEAALTARTVVLGGPSGSVIVPRRVLAAGELERVLAWAQASGAAVSRGGP